MYWIYWRPGPDIRRKGGRVPRFHQAGAIILTRCRFKVLTSRWGGYFRRVLRGAMGYVGRINRWMGSDGPAESVSRDCMLDAQIQTRGETNGANVSMATGEINIAPDYNSKSRLFFACKFCMGRLSGGGGPFRRAPRRCPQRPKEDGRWIPRSIGAGRLLSRIGPPGVVRGEIGWMRHIWRN